MIRLRQKEGRKKDMFFEERKYSNSNTENLI